MNSRDSLYRGIAAEHGTPVYVYDLDLISARIRELRQILPQAAIRYAVKANPQAAVLELLAGSEGAGAEVITTGELSRALKAGVAPEDILVGGPSQPAALRELALASRTGLISLDSSSQWEDWQATLQGADWRPGFLVRVNPGLDPHTHRHLATGSADSKFGMLPAEAARLAHALGQEQLFRGFHVHAGSQIDNLAVYQGVLDVLAPLYDECGGTVLDIGGGYRVPGFPLAGYAELVAGFTRQRNLELIIEPGRWLVAEAGVLLSQVLHVKRGPVTHVIADAGMADLLRPAMYEAEHPLRLLGDGEDRATITVDVDGPLCENADRLGRQVQLPEPRKGDLLVVGHAGAYGMGMASNYASSLMPAEVAISGQSVRLVRRRQEPADLLLLEEQA